MSKLPEELCLICGADKEAYREMMGEECWHGHKGSKVEEKAKTTGLWEYLDLLHSLNEEEEK